MLTDIFPLYAEIWGTVSDWIMIAVTAVTAFFLYKTLNSQRIVQKAQQRITDIEEHQHLERIKPDFDLHFIADNRTNTKEGVKITFHLQFNNMGETANDVKINCTSSTTLNNVSFPLTGNNIQKGMEISAIMIETIVPYTHELNTARAEALPTAFGFMGLNLSFTDIEGNSYKQRFSQYFGSKDYEATKYPPLKS